MRAKDSSVASLDSETTKHTSLSVKKLNENIKYEMHYDVAIKITKVMFFVHGFHFFIK